MAKRKPKKLEPIEKKPKKEREHLDGLDPPNHLVALEPGDHAVENGSRWPMVRLLQEFDGKKAGAFIDARWEADHWYLWSEHPPTWFDPEVFADMAMQDPEIKKILQASWDKQTRKFEGLLPKHLQRVFEEQYLPYMLKQFEPAKKLIAHYLVGRWASMEIQAEVDEEFAEYYKKHGKSKAKDNE